MSSNEADISLIKDKYDLDSIKKFAFPICVKNLGGCWSKATIDEFNLSKLSGGLSNNLYKCQLVVENFEPEDDEPKTVLMRLYGEHRPEEELIVDLVNTTVIGEHKLGPRVLGFFKEGRLEEFVNASSLKHGDAKDSDTNKMIAAAVADFHFLKTPSPKTSTFFFDLTEYLFAQSKQIKFEDEENKNKVEKLLSFNFEKEFEQLKKVIIGADSPIVFSHNDTQMGNILRTYPHLTLIDFEFSAYNYRSFDIGTYFAEQTFNNNTDTYPYYSYNFEDYPSKEKQHEFIQAYIEQVTKNGKKKGIKFNQVMKDLDSVAIEYEANVLALGLLLCSAPWSIILQKDNQRKINYLDFGIDRADCYFKLKNMLFPNGYDSDIFAE